MALRNRKLPRHILVIRNSAMGDVAMVPHALRALREAYPDVRVTVLTRPLFKPFFAGLDVDFLEADYAGRHKGVLGLLRLAGEARRRGIDAVADMHGVLRSRIVGLLLTTLIERITRKKLNPKYEAWINGVGMVLLLLLIAVITFKDIFHLFT